MEWHRSLLEIVEQARENGLVLYGAGFWGKKTQEIFSLFHVSPACFCDDDVVKHNRAAKIPCFSLKDAVEKYPGAVYLVCVDEVQSVGNYEREARERMIAQLKRWHVYQRHSEIHMAFYIFLLDTGLNPIQMDLAQPNRENFFSVEDANQILLFNNMSNSGAYYFEQLVDGHSHFLFLPYIESLENVYLKRMRFLSGEELLIEMAAQLLGYFHSHMEAHPCVRTHRFQSFCVDQNGGFCRDVLINPVDFLYWLRLGLGENQKLKSYAHMLKLYFTAYANCLGRIKENHPYWIFYHMHLPNFDVQNMYASLNPHEFQRVENIIIIREPVQHLYSWIRRVALQQKNRKSLSGTFIFNVLQSDMGEMLKKRKGFENVRAIRLEDLKCNHKNTMRAFCQWLHVPYTENLQDTTLNGYPMYFPVDTKEGRKYITGNDLTAVQLKDFSTIMTPWDEVRLNIFFGAFKKAYGYETTYPIFTAFTQAFLEELLAEPFLLEKIVMDLFAEKKKETLSDGQTIQTVIRKALLDGARFHDEDTLWYDCLGQEKQD